MRIALRSAVVALLVASVVSACDGEDHPTGPSSEEPALAETTSTCGPAPSEFVRSYEGDAEILSLTFEIDSEENQCLLDMASEGILFGGSETDTIDVWVMKKQGGHVSNVPSGERYAMTSENYWGTIVFDPPIRELSFSYTDVDGLRVTVYNQYGWFIQQDSLPLTDNHSDWDPYTVNVDPAGSERIGKVFLDYWDEANTGNFRLDDMEITREAPPAVACDTVVRGEEATCSITRSVDSVLSWTFTGPLEHWLFSPDTVTVTDSTSSTTWTGTAVLPGDVSARVAMDGGVDTVTLTGRLTVDDRPWAWGEADWTWTDSSSTTLCGQQYGPFYHPGGARLAINRRTTDCSNRPLDIIQPSWPDSAYSDARVQDGPNKGLWYVASADFFLDRTAEKNPFIGSNYPYRDTVSGQDAQKCKRFGTVVNFWEYNEHCRKDPLADFFIALWNHEGMGSNQTTTNYQQANGHEARRWLAARDTANDPMRIVEDIVHPDSLAHNALIETGLDDADDRIWSISRDHNYVNDNYLMKNGRCGTAWVYDTAQSSFKEIPMTRQDSATGQIYCM